MIRAILDAMRTATRLYPIEDFQPIAKARGGRVLSCKPVPARRRIRLRCAQGHTFEATATALKQGAWCLECALADQQPHQRKKLAELRRLARRRGGAVVSAGYADEKTELEVRCGDGHTWWAMPCNLRKGSWCPRCARDQETGRGRARLEHMVKQRGGALESEYVNSKTRVRLRCAAGHEWETSPPVIRAGGWCPDCSRDLIDGMHEIAARRGGRCISKRCVSKTEALRWRCANGHIFKTRADRVQAGVWCQRCGGTGTYDMAGMRKLAKSRSGKCLTLGDGPVEITRPLRWECAAGHQWESQPHRVIQRGNWCPQCAIDKRRGVPRTRLTLEDMHETAARHGGECLSDTYVNIATKLRWRCARGHEWEAAPGNVRSGYWCSQCAHRPPYTLEGMRALAKERGGRCLTKHWGDRRTELRFECARGHEFEATRGGIRGGLWCPRCGVSQLPLPQPRRDFRRVGHGTRGKLTLQDMHETARRFGGECVSTDYVSTKAKLRWRCARGHEWEAAPVMIRARATWCPTCSRGKPRTLPQVRALARSRGGRCLTRIPGGKFARPDHTKPVSFECAAGHRFELMWGAIKSGVWCPSCPPHRVDGQLPGER